MERPQERVGPYRLEDELGRGGVGAVFRAVDTRSGAEVALKLLGAVDERARRRLVGEARALARLRHRNVVSLLEAGEERGRPWLALELVRGRSLEQRLLRDGPLPAREAVQLVRALAAGLAHAHREGVLHRDLKPGNVLLPADGGEPKLTDFGLAGFLHVAPDQSRLTKSGMFMGTPGFWAPEQARGERAALGPATDVYGLGTLLYAALTGRPPIEAESLPEYLVATERERPAATGADPALDRLVQRCLEKRPEDRPPSVDAVARELSRWLAGGDERRGPGRALVTAAILTLLGVGVGAAWWLRARPAAPAPPPETRPTPAPPAPEQGPSQEVAALLAAARDHALRREYALARSFYDRVIALDPRCARAYAGRAATRAVTGDPAGALPDYDRAVELEPRNLDTRSSRGQVRAMSGDDLGAVADFDRVLEVVPGSAEHLVSRAVSLAGLGAHRAAIGDCDRALAIDPRSVPALMNRGASRAALGDLGAAVADFEAALANAAPDSEEAASIRMSLAGVRRRLAGR